MTAPSRVLWRRWRTGRDAGAFEQLVRPELAYALDFARRMGVDRAEADDVVQETLVQLAREPGDDPVRVGLRAWICRRVGLRVRMLRRGAARRRVHERASGHRPPPGRDPGAGLESREEVEAALRHLPGPERQAIVLRYLHDLDYREMAYVVGASENALRLRVHRGLARLKRLLGGRAPALLAALVLPAVGAEAAMVHGAVAAAGGKLAAAGGGQGLGAVASWLSTKAGASVATGSVVAVAVTAAVVTTPDRPAPIPPAPVARTAPPEPEPPPPPGLRPWWRAGDRGVHTLRLATTSDQGGAAVATVQEARYVEEVLAAAAGRRTRVRRRYERHRVETTVDVGIGPPVVRVTPQPMEGRTVVLERAGDRWRPVADDPAGRTLLGDALGRLRAEIVGVLPEGGVPPEGTWRAPAGRLQGPGPDPAPTFCVLERPAADRAHVRITTPGTDGRGPEGALVIDPLARRVRRVELEGPFTLDTVFGKLAGRRRFEATWEPR